MPKYERHDDQNENEGRHKALSKDKPEPKMKKIKAKDTDEELMVRDISDFELIRELKRRNLAKTIGFNQEIFPEMFELCDSDEIDTRLGYVVKSSMDNFGHDLVKNYPDVLKVTKPEINLNIPISMMPSELVSLEMLVLNTKYI